MTQHYFSESPSGAFLPREVDVSLAGADRSVLTAGGVFSPDGLDRGTAVLLRELPDPSLLNESGPAGPLLDIGCGWGPIALSAALEHPDRDVWAIDVNERSRELTRQNASRLGLTNVHVASPEDVPADIAFAEIHSNPPIRVGKDALHEILSAWLPRLTSDGMAYLVVAKHLGADSLQRWLETEFPGLAVDRFARHKGFHVIRAVRSAN